MCIRFKTLQHILYIQYVTISFTTKLESVSYRRERTLTPLPEKQRQLPPITDKQQPVAQYDKKNYSRFV